MTMSQGALRSWLEPLAAPLAALSGVLAPSSERSAVDSLEGWGHNFTTLIEMSKRYHIL